MVATFSQIFLNSLLTHISEAYPLKHYCPLPSTCWVVKLQTSVLLSEEVWLLGQHHPFVVTGPRPQPNNLLALINTWLSSGSLASSDVAHGPIPLSNSPIPIETKLIKKEKKNLHVRNDKKWHTLEKIIRYSKKSEYLFVQKKKNVKVSLAQLILLDVSNRDIQGSNCPHLL